MVNDFISHQLTQLTQFELKIESADLVAQCLHYAEYVLQSQSARDNHANAEVRNLNVLDQCNVRSKEENDRICTRDLHGSTFRISAHYFHLKYPIEAKPGHMICSESRQARRNPTDCWLVNHKLRITSTEYSGENYLRLSKIAAKKEQQ